MSEQELRTPFTQVSLQASSTPRAFAQANHDAQHWFPTMDAQTQERGCLLHSGGNCPFSGEVDYLFAGTPCNPFSPMRSKRFSDGSVKSHKMYANTFGDAFDTLTKFNPVSVTFEQSMGFDLPESVDSPVSPLQRLGPFDKTRVLSVDAT